MGMSTMLDAILNSAPPFTQQQPAADVVREPDYESLVEILTRLWQVPDGLGETMLRTEEAADIRACGFAARAGRVWRCPPLPDALVCWNPLLRHLSDAIDPYARPEGWKAKRAPSRLVSYFHPIAHAEMKIIGHLDKFPHGTTKRVIQQKLWRYPARFFNRTLSRLIRDGRITFYDGLLLPYRREYFDILLNNYEEQKRAPKRPRYTEWAAEPATYRFSR
jgi:hypothetical protein